jgi:hypothetical protein
MRRNSLRGRRFFDFTAILIGHDTGISDVDAPHARIQRGDVARGKVSIASSVLSIGLARIVRTR